ncbi:tellurite resistance TerB family protein [Litoreibacter roseus]|uniref:Co-chaperone DjlA N-terminal domain-containing protein n=1 Tax=Litoreibacter roseus TaxID=2601869 RepID=A0A6N6JJB9_9RHOB|nr:TerB family tellurite resistance protein [Litoreibacter roseus]GFE65920.1 hypothetical protein KIN_29940 [Litoreibacter roseus]
MISDFFKRLAAPGPSETPDADARLSLTALLVRIAKADMDYADSEIQQIDAIIMRRYGLDTAGAATLRQEAEEIEAYAADTVQFTRTIKDAVVHEDRETVVEALWELVLADGAREAEEDGILRLVAPLLGVNDLESALIRQRVQSRHKNAAE